MPELYFASDLHLNHRKLVEPDPKTKEIERPFDTLEEMNETLIKNINDIVRPDDKLYLLGDVVFQKSISEPLLERLNGKKTLILGNHDEITSNSYYLKYFKKILLWQRFEEGGFVATHIPIHHTQFRGAALNAHGHVHRYSVKDYRYMNLCVDVHGFKPVHYETVRHEAISARELSL